jgi:hypothetical protein
MNTDRLSTAVRAAPSPCSTASTHLN